MNCDYKLYKTTVKAIQFKDDVECILNIRKLTNTEFIFVDYKDRKNPVLTIQLTKDENDIQYAYIGDYIVKSKLGEIVIFDKRVFEDYYEEVK